MMQYIILAVFLVVAIAGAMYIPAYRQLRSMRWRAGDCTSPIEASRVPADEKALVEEKARELILFGFEPCYWVAINPPLSHPETFIHALVLLHPGTGTYAEVSIHPTPEPGHEFNVEFLHFPRHGEVIYTTNRTRHVLGATPPGYQWEDPYLDKLDDLWKYHQRRIAGQPDEARRLTAEAFCQRNREFFAHILDALSERGDLVRAESQGQYRLTRSGAWRLIRRCQKAAPQLVTNQHPDGEPLPPAHADPRVSVIAHRNFEADMTREPASSPQKLGLLLISLVLFMLSFGLRMDLTAVVILVAVLLFHELGHIAAMRLFGYQRLQVLFIPFLGAIARGEKEGTSPLQGTLIALAGPVPGLLLGGALWLAYPGTGPDWMGTLILMLLFINFFNLLPIYPLDGGQVANLLVFQRWPALQAGFGVLSMIAFFGMAWWLSEPLLAGIGILLAFSLIHQYREAQLLGYVRGHLPEAGKQDPTTQLHAIYQGFEGTSTVVPFPSRFQLARGLTSRLREPVPRRRDCLIGLTLYLAFLLGTPVAAAYQGAVSWPFNDYQAIDWEARLAETEDDSARSEILYSAAQDAYYQDRFQKALDYTARSRQLLEHLGESESLLMAQNLLLSAEVNHYYGEELAGDDEEALERLNREALNSLHRAIDLYQLNEPMDEALEGQADALELLASMAEADEAPDQALDYLKAAEALWRRMSAEHSGYGLVYNLNRQARIQSRLERHSEAVRLLQESMSAARAMDEFSRPYLLRTSANQLIDLHLNLGQHTRALALTDELRGEPDMEPDLSERRAWAQFRLGRYTSARADLESAIATLETDQGSDYRSYYDKEKADYLAQLLMVHHGESREGRTSEPPTRDAQRLLQELDAIDMSLDDYKAHLQRKCDCGNKSGYRHERSLAMRNAVQEYLP